MSLNERLVEYVRACFTGLWIESHEHEDALAEITGLCRQENWPLAVWDIERGLNGAGDSANATGRATAADPLAAIRALSALATPESAALLVLVNFHRFLGSPEIVQALVHAIQQGKRQRTFVAVLAPVVQIPVELEKLLVVLEHELPGRPQLEAIARSIATEPDELPADGLNAVLDAAAGLTRYEAEGAFSLSIIRHGRLEPAAIWEIKTAALKQSGLLTLHRGTEKFSDLGGLEALKAFCTRALRRRDDSSHGRASDAVRPRGTLLLSPPGCGKSAFAKALGNELNRPTLVLDVGSLLGSLVGQSEANVRRALAIADAMAPCVLFVDEIDKALAGVQSSGQTDSGVGARLFGHLLTWLNDHSSDVFVMATCNDISRLPPEFTRAERFDGVFFVDLPDRRQRDAIWKIALARFGLSAKQTRPVDADWTGAEITACCRLAALLEVSLIEAAHNIVPIAKSNCEAVDRLRQWADGRCLSADNPGVFRGRRSGRGQTVGPEPSKN